MFDQEHFVLDFFSKQNPKEQNISLSLTVQKLL